MLKKYKKQNSKILCLVALSVLIFSPAKAELPEEMVLDFSMQTVLHRDVTDVKFECSLEGWLMDDGERLSKAEVATGTVTVPRPTITDVISVHFEPTVDDFERERSLDYVCQMFVRNAEEEGQGWVAVSNAQNTPDIAHVTAGASVISKFFGGRPINLRGTLIGRN